MNNGCTKILIAEDESVIAKDIETQLKKFGFHISAMTYTGEHAVQETARTHPDIALMDIRLKGTMDGVEAAKIIRNRFNVPVIYLTAYADDATLQRAKDTDPLGYILKPFDGKALSVTLQMALLKHQKEKNRRKMDDLISVLLRNLDEAVIVTDNDGCIIFMNQRAETLTGWKEKEVQGKILKEVIQIIDQEATWQRICTGWSARCMIAVKNGKELAVDSRITPIKEAHGGMLGILLILRDTTKQKLTRNKLNAIEERLKLAVESLSDGIWDIDLITNKAYVSHSLKQLLGFDADDFKSDMNFFEKLVHDEDRKCIMNAFTKHRDQITQRCIVEHRLKTKTGEYKWVRSCGKAIRDSEGKPTRLIGTTTDITDEKSSV